MNAEEQKLRTLLLEAPEAIRTNARQLLTWATQDTARFEDVPWRDLVIWVAEYDLRPGLQQLLTTGDDARKTAVQFILDCITAGQALPLSDSRVLTIVGKALPSGPARDALVALARKSVPRWQEAGIDKRYLNTFQIQELIDAK